MQSQQRIGFEIKTLSIMIKRQLDKAVFNLCDSDDHPTGVQGFIIGHLYHHQDQDIFQRDIEKACCIRRSTATGILQLMEKNGYITKEPVDYDARLKKLVLTPKAIDHHHFIEKEIVAIEARLTKDIDAQDLDVFYRVVAKMKSNIQ